MTIGARKASRKRKSATELRRAGALIRIAFVVAFGALLSLSVPTGFALPGTGDSPRQVAPNLVIDSVVFGYVDPKTGDIVASDTIDTRRHLGFGWRIRFRGVPRSIRYREEFLLPAPAANWGVGPSTKVAPNRASATTTETVELGADLTLRHVWYHTDGDPKGVHRINVQVNDIPIQTFRFTIL